MTLIPTDHATAMLSRLVAFDTTSRNSNLALISYVQEYLQQHDIASQLVYNEDRSKANLFATIGPAIQGGVIVSGHTDVVPVDGQDWHTDPFIVTEKDGLLYGRGTADMKSYLAVILAMLPSINRSQLKRPLHLAFSYDEEVGCLGVHSLIDFIKQQDIAPSLAIIGEPTEMQVVNAHKGIRSFETIFTGLEAHSSAVDKGVNAVMYAAELIHFLNEVQEEYKQKPRSEQASRFDPPYTTFHVGMISGGTARNIIPKYCSFNWEFRIIPDDDATVFMARYEQKVAELRAAMQKTSPEADIITRSTAYAPDLSGDTTPEAEAMLLHLTRHNQCRTVAFGTEAGIFQKNGIPALLCGPGNILQAHKPNEYIAISQIEDCIGFIGRLVEELYKK